MKTVLIPRPNPQAQLFAATLGDGFAPVISPLIEIVPTGENLELGMYSGLIFTSVNGIQSVAAQLEGCAQTAWCVGRRTGDAASALGLPVQVGNSNAQGLVEMITSQKPDGKLLHIRGQHSACDIVEQLSIGGVLADEVVVYRQDRLALTPGAKSELASGRIDAVVLFSARTARIFAEETAGIAFEGTRLLCLSRNVAEVLGDPDGARIEIAARPDQKAMLELLEG